MVVGDGAEIIGGERQEAATGAWNAGPATGADQPAAVPVQPALVPVSGTRCTPLPALEARTGRVVVAAAKTAAGATPSREAAASRYDECWPKRDAVVLQFHANQAAAATPKMHQREGARAARR